MPFQPTIAPPYRWRVRHAIPDFDPELSAVAEGVERDVFHDSLGYSREVWEREYSGYRGRTVWILLTREPEGIPVGSVRAIVGPVRETKFVADLKRLWGVEWDDAIGRHGLTPDISGIEFSTLSVKREYRTADRRWPVRVLAAAFAHLVWDLDVGYGLQIQDVIGIRSLSFVLRIPIEPLGGLPPVDFYGPIQPTICRVWDTRTLLETRDDEYRRLYCHRDESGRGGTRLPPLDLTERGPLALHRRLVQEYAEAVRSQSIFSASGRSGVRSIIR